MLSWFKIYRLEKKIIKYFELESDSEISDRINKIISSLYIKTEDGDIRVLIKRSNFYEVDKYIETILPEVKNKIAEQQPEYIFSNFEKNPKYYFLLGTQK